MTDMGFLITFGIFVLVIVIIAVIAVVAAVSGAVTAFVQKGVEEDE